MLMHTEQGSTEITLFNEVILRQILLIGKHFTSVMDNGHLCLLHLSALLRPRFRSRIRGKYVRFSLSVIIKMS